MSADRFPQPNGMGSFWRSEIGHLDDHRTTQALPDECDILIIGAGYSGGSILTHLLSQDELGSQKVLVLEARQLCSGATGRNGGHFKPDVYNLPSSMSEEYGIEAANEIAEFELANLEAVQNYVRSSGAKCDFVLTKAVDVQLSESHDKSLKARYDRFLSAGGKAAKNATRIEGDNAEKVFGVKGAKGAFTYTAAHAWPYKLIHHMFTEALKYNQVNIQTNTPVTSIPSHPGADGRWTVQTSRGPVRATKVIMATNAYTAALLPEYHEKIIPYRAICSRIVTPKGSKHPPLKHTAAIRFTEWNFDYLIPREDGSIVVGGARKDYLRHLDDWYGNVDDSKLITRAKDYFNGYMQRHFKGWEDSGATTDQVWTGIMGYSSDRLPHVGLVPDRYNFFIMAGFTGHGMPQVFLAAKGLSQMVLQGTLYRDTGLPRLFQESSSRLTRDENFVMDLYNNLPMPSRL